VNSTYICELTESMLADGFSEEEVARYAGLVERDSKRTELELGQRELAVQIEVKKLNRAIGRIKTREGPPLATVRHPLWNQMRCIMPTYIRRAPQRKSWRLCRKGGKRLDWRRSVPVESFWQSFSAMVTVAIFL
jgi:hypothetical protein